MYLYYLMLLVVFFLFWSVEICCFLLVWCVCCLWCLFLVYVIEMFDFLIVFVVGFFIWRCLIIWVDIEIVILIGCLLGIFWLLIGVISLVSVLLLNLCWVSLVIKCFVLVFELINLIKGREGSFNVCLVIW